MQEETDSQVFAEITTSFSLDVSLKLGKLKIRLKDFSDWAVYEKEYTEKDIGLKEIHRKAEL